VKTFSVIALDICEVGIIREPAYHNLEEGISLWWTPRDGELFLAFKLVLVLLKIGRASCRERV